MHIIKCMYMCVYTAHMVKKPPCMGAKSGMTKKTVTKRSDMRTWPRLIIHLRWKGKAIRSSSYIYVNNICMQGITVG